MNIVYLTSGRYACVLGLKNLGLKKGDKILIPEYICSTLVEKINENNFSVKFYSLKSNFDPDWKSISKEFDNKVKAIIMVNYFGQTNNISKFTKFCKKKKIYLVEDNSHGFGNKYKGKLLGTFGDIGFSSPYKKIPNLISGGVLYSKKSLNKSLFMPRYQPKLIDFLKVFIKINVPWVKKIKFYFNKNDYLNPYLRLDSKITDGVIDNYSFRKIIKTDISKINANLINSYKIQSKFLKKIPFKFKLIKNRNVPWKLVIMTNNEETSSKIISIGKKSKILITTWPSLPFSLIKNNSRLISFWKKILVISIDQSYLNIINK
jgi:perosamine synthetase|tara:strand:+ start:918 stop:1874 length:957 start_codon:yes stop_codon:yes gene_type:complete